jgi:PiT family inorganic phosphate transporter
MTAETMMMVAMLSAGAYVGWNIGGNDAANCIGTMVGAGIMPFRKAALLMGVFVILGGVLQGHRVMKTVGKGVVITNNAQYEKVHKTPPPPSLVEHFPDQRLPDTAILTASLCAGIFVTLATFFSVPVSTSQAIVGGVAGVGIGLVGLDGRYFNQAVLTKILGCWLISPMLSLALAFLIFHGLRKLSQGVGAAHWQSGVSMLVIASACYVSYSLGANDVGNAIGPLLVKFPDHGINLALMGGVAMAIGALTIGRRVTDTVGKSITPLDLTGALAAQTAAAVGVHLFSVLGIPVSTSQAIVGAVIGVGLTKGMQAVSTRKIVEIAVGCVAAPLLAAITAALVYILGNRFLF